MDAGLSLPRSECLDYCRWTKINSERVIWYPDRKHFIIGKRLIDEFLAACKPAGAS